jgi:hypothetical protein
MSPTRTHVSFLFDIDPKLTFLPGGLLNWGVKFIAHYAFSVRFLSRNTRNISVVSLSANLSNRFTYTTIAIKN